jgi:nitroreductase
MKRLLRKIFPSLGPRLHIVLGYIYDINKFIKTTTSINAYDNKLKLEAILARQYHGIEKGFVMPKPRLGFGQPLIKELIKNVIIYYKKYGYTNLVQIVLDTLNTYVNFHQDSKNIISDLIFDINELNNIVIEKGQIITSSVGFKFITKDEYIKKATSFNFKEFSSSRCSIRDFAIGDIPINIIKKAVIIASEAPSACNRQAWKVHVFKGKRKETILNHQNGNKGFRESIDTVLLITGLNTSFSHKERHGVWVDGGIFSMALIFAFHSQGIGSCALNTSYSLKEEKALRKTLNLNIEQEPIMMLALGNIKPEFLVANSPRKLIDDILINE